MSKSSRSYQRKDRFFNKAKEDKFVARSVYKLDELDRRYGILEKNQTVVDLGCAPGSWLQYVTGKLGKKGLAVGYDIVPVEVNLGPRADTFVADVFALSPIRIWTDLARLAARPTEGEVPDVDTLVKRPPRVDAVISDMAPKLTGIRDADQAKSVTIVSGGLRLAQAMLPIDKGVFVAKLFQGRDTDELVLDVKKAFREVKLLKPEATREGSREVFVLARRLRPEGRIPPWEPEPEPADFDPIDDAD